MTEIRREKLGIFGQQIPKRWCGRMKGLVFEELLTWALNNEYNF